MPQIVFYGWGAVATGLLNAERRFAVPMFAPILNNLTVIATMLVFAVMSHGRHPGVDRHHHGGEMGAGASGRRSASSP